MVFQAKKKDLAVICDLAVKIWGGDEKMMEKEFAPRLNNKNIAILIVKDEGMPAGFIECSLHSEKGERLAEWKGFMFCHNVEERGLQSFFLMKR